MDYNILPSADIVSDLASSTTNYVEVLSPIFLFVIGIILAVAIVTMLTDLFNEWLEDNRILNEYTTLREEEAGILGTDFGDFKTEKENSRRIIRTGAINSSVSIVTARDRLAEINERKRSLQDDL